MYKSVMLSNSNKCNSIIQNSNLKFFSFSPSLLDPLESQGKGERGWITRAASKVVSIIARQRIKDDYGRSARNLNFPGVHFTAGFIDRPKDKGYTASCSTTVNDVRIIIE